MIKRLFLPDRPFAMQSSIDLMRTCSLDCLQDFGKSIFTSIPGIKETLQNQVNVIEHDNHREYVRASVVLPHTTRENDVTRQRLELSSFSCAEG